MQKLLLILALIFFTHSTRAEAESTVTGHVDFGVDYQPLRWNRLLPRNESDATLITYSKVSLRYKNDLSDALNVTGNVGVLGRGKMFFENFDKVGSRLSVTPQGDRHWDGSLTFNELYGRYNLSPELAASLGKLRLSWGTGYSANPIDVMNPSKDPTDPDAQEQGAWAAAVDTNFENHAHTFVVSPWVIHNDWGVPKKGFRYRDDGHDDKNNHYLIALRNYFLVNNSDIGVVFYYTHLYGDELDTPRLGLTFSRYFFKDYEFHIEGLTQKGNSRDTKKMNTQVLFGTRYMFENEALLNVEYLYKQQGLSRDDFENYVNLREAIVSGKARVALPTNLNAGFLLGRHYILAALQRAKIVEDFYFNLNAIAGLEDTSTVLIPQFLWSGVENLELTTSVLSPFVMSKSSGVLSRAGERYSEVDFLPIQYRLRVQARWYF